LICLKRVQTKRISVPLRSKRFFTQLQDVMSLKVWITNFQPTQNKEITQKLAGPCDPVEREDIETLSIRSTKCPRPCKRSANVCLSAPGVARTCLQWVSRSQPILSGGASERPSTHGVSAASFIENSLALVTRTQEAADGRPRGGSPHCGSGLLAFSDSLGPLASDAPARRSKRTIISPGYSG
jgi:hypothetical protein